MMRKLALQAGELLIKPLPYTLYHHSRRYLFKKSNPKRYNFYQNRRRVDTKDGYSYKPFDDNKCIFVHIPKCAGVSLNKALFGNLAGGHATLDEYMMVFEPADMLSYFKFTIVRNPWDRLVSAFHFLKSGGFNEQDKRWAEENLSDYSDFDSFVRNWVNDDNIWTWVHFKPQHHFYKEKNDKIKLNFIAYLENIDIDLDYISIMLNKNLRIDNHNKSRHKDYKMYYNQATIDIVEKVYKKDIEELGYVFDNSNIENVIDLRNKMLVK